MENKQIIFTDIKQVEAISCSIGEPAEDEVLVEVVYSAISNGTEKANLLFQTNLSVNTKEGDVRPWPRELGYSAAGRVVKCGARINDLKPGQNVSISWGHHSRYCLVKRNDLVVIPKGVSLEEASLATIASFPLAAVRKTKVEIGESAIVMGLGMLGIFAVQFYRLAGAAPVIAVDPLPSRRQQALKFGADYALDPCDPEFVNLVKKYTDGGVNCAVEVTGVGEAFNEVLDVMAKLGRVALLGCTRNYDFKVDYYHKVHGPGISIIGAHTFARPEHDSYRGYWTQSDDINAILKLIKSGRLNFKDIVSNVYRPEEAPDVYSKLCEDKDFPLGVLFNWE